MPVTDVKGEVSGDHYKILEDFEKRLTLIETKMKESGSRGETNKDNAAKSPASNPATEAPLKDATSPSNQPKRKSNPNTGKKSNCEVS